MHLQESRIVGPRTSLQNRSWICRMGQILRREQGRGSLPKAVSAAGGCTHRQVWPDDGCCASSSRSNGPGSSSTEGLAGLDLLQFGRGAVRCRVIHVMEWSCVAFCSATQVQGRLVSSARSVEEHRLRQVLIVLKRTTYVIFRESCSKHVRSMG